MINLQYVLIVFVQMSGDNGMHVRALWLLSITISYLLALLRGGL
jgi:hypothetical protein